MSEITTFQHVQDKIKESVKVQFFNLLPDEAFQKLIQEEINAFFEVKNEEYVLKSGSYNNSTLVAKISPFRVLVWDQVKELTKVRMKELLESPEFKEACMGPGTDTSLVEAGKDRFERLAIAMSGTFFQQVMLQAMHQTKMDINAALNSAGINVSIRY
jgi:hypothetical protein